MGRFLNLRSIAPTSFLPDVILRHGVGIDHLIGAAAKKEKSAGGVRNGAAAGERV